MKTPGPTLALRALSVLLLAWTLAPAGALAEDRPYPPAPPPPPPPRWTPEERAGRAAPPPNRTLPPVAAPAPAAVGDPDAVDDPQEEEPIIRRIVFEGNLLYATEMMKTRLQNKEGARLDRAALDADMREMYRYFSEIQIVKDKVPGGIVLRFRVSENPLIVKLDIRGNDEMNTGEIRSLMRTQVGFPLSPYHMAADREDIVEAYKAKGFYFADVPEPRVATLPNGGRCVTFTIVEGPEVQVSRILFRGNQAVPRKKLIEVMLTEQISFFENIFGGEVFREDVLREDLVALKMLYRSEGFLDVEVALDDLRFSDDKSRVEVVIAIEEHASPTADDLAYFTEERIACWFGLRTGCRFSGETADEGIDKIQEEYFARSYLDAGIGTPQLRGREKELVVDIELTVHEGPKYRLARIDFVGNEFTRDKILRREVKTSPGGYVDRNQLDRGLTRIQRSGFFDRTTMTVHDALDPDGEPIEGWKQATYELVEASTGKVSFGVSLSTNGGFGAQVEFRKRNFDIARWPRSWADISSGRAWTGAGQEFNILLSPSTQVTQFRVSFREPRFFGSDFSFETSLYKNFEFRESYTVDRGGYTLGFGYPLYKNSDDTIGLVGRVLWRNEWDRITGLAADAIPGAWLFRDKLELRSVSGTLSLWTSDDFVNPRYTTNTSLRAELAGTFLGGDLDFWGLTGQHSQTWVAFVDEDGKKHRVLGRVTCGLMEALEDTPEVPPYERLYAGGRSLRGWRFRGVGPHVNGYPTGGEWMLTGSLEYELPLVRKMLSVVVFSDVGTVAESISAPNAFSWRIAIGGGLRFAIPFLLGEQPLALDFAFPVQDRPEDERQVVSFSMGRGF